MRWRPHIDAITMTIHHGKHHRAYYDKMVAALEGTEALALPIERVLARVSNYGAAVRNNAGGYFNHCAFWNMMSPDGGGEPVGSLAGEVDRAFGSADKLREEISAAGIARFGSGFAWLIVKDRQLKVVSTPNQDNPLMDVIDESARGIPILGWMCGSTPTISNTKIAARTTLRRFGKSSIGKPSASILNRRWINKRISSA